MLAELSSREFAGWAAFFEIEPWGCAVEDHRAGVIAASVINMAGMRSKRQDYTPSDLFPPRNQPLAPRLPIAERVKAFFRRKG